MAKPEPLHPAALSAPSADNGVWRLSGAWTAFGVGAIERELETINVSSTPASADQIDGAAIEALDTAGALQLQKFLQRARASSGGTLALCGLKPAFARLMDAVDKQVDAQDVPAKPAVAATPGLLDSVGRSTVGLMAQAAALLAFIGDIALAFVGCLAHPKRIRWRPILFNIRTAGFDALPIVGLLAFLLGIVVAYQGADQLRRYGANIFVVDLVGPPTCSQGSTRPRRPTAPLIWRLRRRTRATRT